MKRCGSLLLAAILGISLAGCVSAQGRPDYTASGALAGGATGAIVGGLTRHPGPGALVGAVVGGLIGHGMDQDQEKQLRTQAPQTLQRVEQNQPLTVEDVKALTKAKISDDLIISQIRNSRTVYHLATADIIALKNAGVSDRVIDYMINTPTQSSSAQVEGNAETVPSPPQTVVVAPGPGYFWVDGSWIWFGDHWSWRHGYWHRPMHHYGRHHWH